MAQKRSSNARQKRGTSKAQAPATQSIRHTLAGDIVGVALVVLAVALAIALAVPSQAPITRATGNFLRLAFGMGAFLCPLAVGAFAVTFFVDVEDASWGRVAAGMLALCVSVLSLLSINATGVDLNPDLALEPGTVVAHGGYVGGLFAWGLLGTVGQLAGDAILVGVFVVGALLCGFSISDLVGRLSERRAAARERRDQRRADREQERQEADLAAGLAQAGEAEPYLPFEDVEAVGEEAPEGQTTFLGSRKTSVLTRDHAGEEDSDATPAAGRTRLLRRRHPNLDEDKARPADGIVPIPTIEGEGQGQLAKTTLLGNRKGKAGDEPQEQLPFDEGEPQEDALPREAVVPSAEPADPAIPSFLVDAGQRAERQRRGTPRLDTPEGQEAEARRHPVTQVPSATGSTRQAAPVVANTPVPSRPAAVRSPRKEADQDGGQEPLSLEATNTEAHRLRAARAGATRRPGEGDDSYRLPPFSMLSSNPHSGGSSSSREELEETKARLQATLQEFGLRSRVVDYVSGPLVTTFRIEMGEGERVNKIRNLEDDIALTLAAEKVRIFAPIPGTSFVGIEIPNHTRENVHLGDVLPYAKGGPLEVAIGRDSSGRPVVADIAKMPHMLVAGTTGSGKSVMINSMIMSILMRATPKQVRLILIDPKRVEFSGYNGLPHLYVPVVTEPRQAASALQWTVSEMERRLKVFEKAGAREIKTYNKMCVSGKLSEMDNPPEPMPYIVVIIDELSDLMMVAGKDVEASIVRIAQLARAAGIHLVIATQRPSTNVVTGLIKSNIDNRVALKVSSGIDSRVILDETGAERLLGNGDMLFKYRGLSMRRVLGCYTSDEEIEKVVAFIRDQAEPDYHNEILSQVMPGKPGGGGGAGGMSEEDDADDPLVWEAARIVVDSQLGSTSGLQRRLKVGYARAGRIMDLLEQKGVVGPPDGSKPREVLLDKEGLEDLKVQEEKYREV